MSTDLNTDTIERLRATCRELEGDLEGNNQ